MRRILQDECFTTSFYSFRIIRTRSDEMKILLKQLNFRLSCSRFFTFKWVFYLRTRYFHISVTHRVCFLLSNRFLFLYFIHMTRISFYKTTETENIEKEADEILMCIFILYRKCYPVIDDTLIYWIKSYKNFSKWISWFKYVRNIAS